MPRGRTEIFDFRDDERRSLSNHLTPRHFTAVSGTSHKAFYILVLAFICSIPLIGNINGWILAASSRGRYDTQILAVNGSRIASGAAMTQSQSGFGSTEVKRAATRAHLPDIFVIASGWA